MAASVRENALRQWLACDWSFLRGMAAGAGVGCSLGHDGQEVVTSESVVDDNGYSSDGAGLNPVGDSDACVVGGTPDVPVTPCVVPCAAHSDSCPYRRVKCRSWGVVVAQHEMLRHCC